MEFLSRLSCWVFFFSFALRLNAWIHKLIQTECVYFSWQWRREMSPRRWTHRFYFPHRSHAGRKWATRAFFFVFVFTLPCAITQPCGSVCVFSSSADGIRSPLKGLSCAAYVWGSHGAFVFLYEPVKSSKRNTHRVVDNDVIMWHSAADQSASLFTPGGITLGIHTQSLHFSLSLFLFLSSEIQCEVLGVTICDEV